MGLISHPEQHGIIVDKKADLKTVLQKATTKKEIADKVPIAARTSRS
jgi:hypothetical protein